MPKPWDDTMKRLIRLNPQDFVSWLLYGAQYKGSVSIELKNWTRETDFLLGLLPLLPLTKDGAQRVVIEEMVTRLVAAEQYDLLSEAKMFAGLVLKDETDREWLKRRFAVYKDILEDSWVYQEIKQESELKVLQHALLKVVQGRFPEMLEVTRKQIDGIENPASLEGLLVNISLAQDVQEALQALVALSKDTQEN